MNKPRSNSRSDSTLILSGLLAGLAPMLVYLVGLMLVPRGSDIGKFVVAMLCIAPLFTITGGWLIALAATRRTGQRILIAAGVAVGMFALDCIGGFFLGCFTIMVRES